MIKIAIVGAGPVGCMLARLLHQGGVDAVVYEGEASHDYRSQGGTLDLHEATGLAAMREAGLLPAFLAHARYDGEYMLLCDQRLRPLLTKGAKDADLQTFGGARPEIDRAALRQILAESLPADMIHWGHRLKGVAVMDGAVDGATTGTGTGTGQKTVLTFADGTTAAGFDLVVGADGAWSKVRAVLSSQLPLFSGMAAHELHVPDAARTAPELVALVRGGSVFAQAEGRKLAVQQMGDGSLVVAAFCRHGDQTNVPNVSAGSEGSEGSEGSQADCWQHTCGFDPHDRAAVQHALVSRSDLFADFHPRLLQAIASAEGATTPRSLYALPVGFRWSHRPGVTLVGDAAHLMTPFAGEGVNTGLDDARHLARALLDVVKKKKKQQQHQKHQKHQKRQQETTSAALAAAVVAYESEMWTRSARVAKLTDDLMRTWFFTPGPPRSVLPTAVALHVKFRSPALVHPLADAAVHSYYFLHHLLGYDKVGEDQE